MAITDILARVEKPGRYVGGELNQVVKETVRARLLLCFADVYEVAMSHIGLHVLYNVVNQHPDFAAERCYAPWPDLENELRATGTLLWSLETRRPMREHDLIGFTLQYELAYPTVLAMLELGGVPVRSADRTSDDPFVIAGGSGAFNPEPMADFIDAFLIGEGEDAILEMCALIAQARTEKWPRERVLTALARIPGMYVPRFFDFAFEHGGPIASITPTLAGYEAAHRRVVANLDTAPFPMKPLVPNVAIVHDRIGIEVQRGCTKGCRFCQAGMIFRPTRQRSPETVLRLTEASLNATGQDEVSFLSLSIGDYEPLQPLLKAFFDKYRSENVGVSLPSLRTETLTQDVVEEIARGGKHSFTLAPEAGSDRMRRIINKGNTEASLLQAVETAVNAGWTTLKYYFMIGLPFERQADRDAIAELAFRSRARAKALNRSLTMAVAVSSFVPKPHTPFQWEPQIGEDEVRAEQDKLRTTLRKAGIQFRYHNAGQTWVEGIISRGDRRVGDMIYAAYKLGARLDAWDDFFKLEIWQEAVKALEPHGLDWRWYQRRRGAEEILPWDRVDAGPDKKFLLKDLSRAQREADVEDCAWGRCFACTACDFNTIEPRVYPRESLYVPEVAPRIKSPLVTRLRVGFAKRGVAALLSHLEMAEAIQRMTRRLRLDLVHSSGFHPKPALSFSPALPLNMESDAELCDIDVHGDIEPSRFLAELQRSPPAGMEFLSAERIAKTTPSLGIATMTYAAIVDARDAIARFGAAPEWIVSRVHHEREHVFDLKREVSELLQAGDTLLLTLHVRSDGSLKADDVMRALELSVVVRKVAMTLGTPQPRMRLAQEATRPARAPKPGAGHRHRDDTRRDRQRAAASLAHAPFTE